MELILLIIVLCIYFLPAIIAFRRNHESKGGIFFLNLFLGWTLLIWVAAFVWAFSSASNNTQTPKANISGVAKELESLAKLKEQGVITEQEFAKQKAQLLGS